MEVRMLDEKRSGVPAATRCGIDSLPTDWRVLSVKEIAATRANAIVGGPFGSDLVSKDYVAIGVPVVRGQNMAHHYISGDFAFVSPEKAKQLQANTARAGDVIFTQRGTLGQVSLVPVGSFEEYVVSQSQMKLTPNARLACAEYVYQYFVSTWGQRQIIESAIQTGVPHTNLGILQNYEIPFPPNLNEQQAIAETLSNADALIESLSLLLAKKRQIKQGAMQELLTGKKRLPGCDVEWKEKSLGELFQFSGGLSASRDQLSTSGHLYLHYGDIHTSAKNFIDCEAEGGSIPRLDIALGKVSPTALLSDGDVVFVDASEDDDGVSKHVVVVNPNGAPFIAGLHTIVAKQRRGELNSLYLRYCFQTQAAKEQFKFYAVGTKVSGISKKNIAKIILHVPAHAEQLAIASILVSIDEDIAAVEKKLSKAQQLKHGMMQELLTGRVRLMQPVSKVIPRPVKAADAKIVDAIAECHHLFKA